MAHSSDERDSARYPTVPNEGRLGWRVGEEKVQTAAQIANISQSGALVFTEDCPPVKQAAWICLEQPARTAWIQTLVVGAKKVRKGLLLHRVSYVVRLRFRPTCPFEFFKVATHGKQLDATFLEAEPEEADQVIWR